MWDQATVKLTGGAHGIPSEQVAQIQRDRLLKAMALTVADVGYQRATVGRVLSHAGLSRRTYYELFPDKESCFLAAHDEVADHVLGLLTAAHEQGSSPQDRITKVLDAFLEFCSSEPEIARLWIVETLGAGSTVRARHADAVDRLAALLEESLREIHPDEGKLPQITARCLLGGVQEILLGLLGAADHGPPSDLAERIVATQVAPALAQA